MITPTMQQSSRTIVVSHFKLIDAKEIVQVSKYGLRDRIPARVLDRALGHIPDHG